MSEDRSAAEARSDQEPSEDRSAAEARRAHEAMSGELSASQVVALGRLLASERRATSARLAGLARQFDAIVESSALSASDDEHDPEGSTVGFERAQVAALMSQAQRHLDAADRARERLRAGSHGVCERCGRQIGFDRLAAHPTAANCVDCASPRGAGRIS